MDAKYRKSVPLSGVQSDCALGAARGLSGLGDPFEAGSDRRRHDVRVGERGPALGELGIDLKRLFKKLNTLRKSSLDPDLLDHRSRLEVQGISFAVVGHLARRCRRRCKSQSAADRCDDIGADNLAPLKEVLDRAAEPVRPDFCACLATDKCEPDIDSGLAATYLAFNKMRNPKQGGHFG